MKAKVILHNSISLDGSFTGLHPDMQLHYHVVSHFKPDVYMVGSTTAKTGIELFGSSVREETSDDFNKPDKNSLLAYWAIPDSGGSLKGLLHYYRQFEFCRDVIVLVSRATPTDYLSYLDERDYDYILAGNIHVDYERAFYELSDKYKTHTILVDTGSTLGNILLNKNLIDVISLIISPEIVGIHSKNLFEK